MTREDGRRGFDPNQPGTSDTLWGLPFTTDDAALVVVPVPWEVTVSYGAGTAGAPKAILSASNQVDLFHPSYPGVWRKGVALAEAADELTQLNDASRPAALTVIKALAAGETPEPSGTEQVNRACERMVEIVRSECASRLERGQRVGVLGGDHSTPLGLIRALADTSRGFGILHVDAHCDLRKAYEGFAHSHASIMANAMERTEVSKLVQVGVRDYCDEEYQRVRDSDGRIVLFDEHTTSRRRFGGEAWGDVASSIVDVLPEQVYVSFDVDGLDPSLCPGTGTPVPGGLSFNEAMYLVDLLVEEKKRVIGFDLSEVSAGGARGSEWDANVGARILYRLSCALLASMEEA